MRTGGCYHYGIIIRLVFHWRSHCVKPTKGEIWKIRCMYMRQGTDVLWLVLLYTVDRSP